jgi:hypothetical protein
VVAGGNLWVLLDQQLAGCRNSNSWALVLVDLQESAPLVASNNNRRIFRIYLGSRWKFKTARRKISRLLELKQQD